MQTSKPGPRTIVTLLGAAGRVLLAGRARFCSLPRRRLCCWLRLPMSALEKWREEQRGRLGPAPTVERDKTPVMTRPGAELRVVRPPVSQESSPRPGYAGGTTLSSPYGARPEQRRAASPGFRSLSPQPRGVTPQGSPTSPKEGSGSPRMPSPSKLRRFRLDRTLMSAAVAAASAEFYTEESLLHRLSLMKHPAVRTHATLFCIPMPRRHASRRAGLECIRSVL